ncbi:MAG: hypothetical protein WBH01_08865 [Dehalococcoidia bacterium]
MNLDHLRNELAKFDWKQSSSGSHLGVDFDLVAKRGTVARWYVLVKMLPRFDRQAAAVWQQIYDRMNEQCKSRFGIGYMFTLCLIAEEVEVEATHMISSDPYESGLGTVSGGGFVMIADMKRKVVHGRLTSSLLDARRKWKTQKEILSRTLNLEGYAPPQEHASEKLSIVVKASHGGTTVPAPGTYEHDYGTVIHINAIPEAGFKFAGWIGDVADSYSQTTSANVDKDKIVTASFEPA